MGKLKIFERKNKTILLYPYTKTPRFDLRYLVTHFKKGGDDLETYRFYRKTSAKNKDYTAYRNSLDALKEDKRYNFNHIDVFENMYKLEITNEQTIRYDVAGRTESWELESLEFTSLLNQIWIWSGKRFQNKGELRQLSPYMGVVFWQDEDTIGAGFGSPMDMDIVNSRRTYRAPAKI